MDDFHIVALFALTRSRIHRETLGVLMKVVNNYFDRRSTIGYIITHKFIVRVKVIWCCCIRFQPNALRMKIGIFNQLFLTGRIFQKQVKVVTNFGLPMLGSRTLCCPCTLPEINKALASTGHLFCKSSMGVNSTQSMQPRNQRKSFTNQNFSDCLISGCIIIS